jgi:trimeric autotransporter adhesin
MDQHVRFIELNQRNLIQADRGKFLRSTIERKQMSTKTLRKRIALVAVSALGFGLMSVAPSQAGAQTSVTVSDASTTVFVGDTAKLAVSVVVVGATTTVAAADVITLTPTLVSQPTGATAPTVDAAEAAAAASVAVNRFELMLPGSGNTASSAAASAVYVPSASTNNIVLTPAANAAAGTYAGGSLDFKANTPGTYTFRVTPTLGTLGSTVATAGTFTVKVLSVGGTIGDGGAVASPFNTVNGVAGTLNYVTLKATGAARTAATVGTQVVVTGGTILSATAGTVSADKTSLVIAGVNHATNAGTDSTIQIATPTVGTITVRTFVETSAGIYSSTAADTVTITVNAAAQTGTLAVANSALIMDGTGTLTAGGFDATADETVLVSRNAATVANNPTEEVAIIRVTLKDTLNANMPDTTPVSAVIAGPGVLGIGATPTDSIGRAVSSTTTSGIVYVTVYRDGSAGKSTITISSGTTTIGTETVTFYGSAASYTAKVNKAHVPSSGAATTDVVAITARDADGNLVPSHTIFASVGTSTVATVEASDATGATGVANFNVTGLATKFGAVTITFGNAATSATVTTTAVVGVSSVRAATIEVATDKAEYAPGEKITLTFTAKDSNGLGLPDGSYAAGDLLANSASNPVATSSLTTTPFLGSAAVVLSAGVATATAFAPLVSGPISWSWTVAGTAGGAATTNLAAALLGTTVSASAKVGQSAAEEAANAASDAAAEATDAANAATDAANAAAEAADAATAAAQDAADAVAALATSVSEMVNALKRQITSLTNLVIKIQKKVRA